MNSASYTTDGNTVIKPILLVEDYPANVLVATSFLELFGYTYEVVNNGVDAVDKIKQFSYGIVLMDVQMHGLNGYEASRIIREHEKQQGKTPVPIIGMTAHALLGDRERCISAGMNDYISKPFNPQELEDKLAHYIGGTIKPDSMVYA